MRKKMKLNVVLLMFLLAVLTVLIVLPEKSNANTLFPGIFYTDPVWGSVCECPMLPVSCICSIRLPLPSGQ